MLGFFEHHPIADVALAAESLGVSYNTAASSIGRLRGAGIVRETTNAARNRSFSYEPYLDILREGS